MYPNGNQISILKGKKFHTCIYQLMWKHGKNWTILRDFVHCGYPAFWQCTSERHPREARALSSAEKQWFSHHHIMANLSRVFHYFFFRTFSKTTWFLSILEVKILLLEIFKHFICQKIEGFLFTYWQILFSNSSLKIKGGKISTAVC